MTADEALQLTINSPDIKSKISEVEKSITEAARKGCFLVHIHPNVNEVNRHLHILAKVFHDRGFTIEKLMTTAYSDTISCLTIKWA